MEAEAALGRAVVSAAAVDIAVALVALEVEVAAVVMEALGLAASVAAMQPLTEGAAAVWGVRFSIMSVRYTCST